MALSHQQPTFTSLFFIYPFHHCTKKSISLKGLEKMLVNGNILNKTKWHHKLGTFLPSRHIDVSFSHWKKKMRQ
jgi:hypothetical protein